MILYALTLFFCLYASACAWLCWRWLILPVRPQVQDAIYDMATLQISVVIPVRNEALHIETLLDDLYRQSLPKTAFEVIVVNDASTDDTALIVKRFQKNNAFHLTLVELPDIAHTSPKKRAITEALQIASGHLIVTTDGDCSVGAEWLETILRTHQQTGAKCISGPVSLTLTPSEGLSKQAIVQHNARLSFGQIFQAIEFSSLIGTGACLLEAGAPTMCNGANLAYECEAFVQVGGYAGVEHLASGDDEFLLQKIAQRYPQQIYFLKNPKAIVHTYAQPTWRAFYRQRVRWASKWAANGRIATMIAAVFVFLTNVMTLGLGIWAFFEGFAEPSTLLLLLLKYSFEFVFLSFMMSFFKQPKLIFWIPIIQLIYPFYVLFFGLAAQQKTYEWKNRKLR